MTREEKYQLVSELTEKLGESPFFYIVDAAGMSVAEINGFRGACFEKGIEYRVIKNKLIAKALQQKTGDYTELEEKALKGFSGVLFASEEMANVPAKMLKEYYKKNDTEMPAFKAAVIDGGFYFGADMLDPLSKLKSKMELIGEVIGLLQGPAQKLASQLKAPAQNLVGALNSGGGTLHGLLKALEERQNG